MDCTNEVAKFASPVLDPRLVTAKRTTTGGGQVLKANAIVPNSAKYNTFNLTEAAFDLVGAC